MFVVRNRIPPLLNVCVATRAKSFSWHPDQCEESSGVTKKETKKKQQAEKSPPNGSRNVPIEEENYRSERKKRHIEFLSMAKSFDRLFHDDGSFGTKQLLNSDCLLLSTISIMTL